MPLSRTSSTRRGPGHVQSAALLASVLQEGTKVAASATASVRVSVGPKFVAPRQQVQQEPKAIVSRVSVF